MKNIYLDNSFILYLLLIILTCQFNNFILYFSLIIIHELGHIITLKLLKIKIKKLSIYSFGCITTYESLININLYKELLISISGIIMQNIGFIIIYKLTNNNNLIYYNKILTIFNLLPIYSLDGYKILNTITSYHLTYYHSFIYSTIISIIYIIILNIKNIYKLNINIIIISIILLCKLIKNIKDYNYIYNKFLLERLIYNLKFNKTKKINNIKYLYKNKKHIIKNIDEKTYLKYYYNRNIK